MNITLLLHDNTEIKADIESYIAKEFADMLNVDTHLMFAFGDNVIQKHSVRRVFPTVTQPIETTPVS